MQDFVSTRWIGGFGLGASVALVFAALISREFHGPGLAWACVVLSATLGRLSRVAAPVPVAVLVTKAVL